VSVRLYVGNVPFDTEESDLKQLFAEVGAVKSCDLVMDRFTNRPRGFAFVEMESADDASAAIEQCNGKTFQGRDLTVNEARPRSEGRRDSGGGGYQGGGGGGYQGGGGGGGYQGGDGGGYQGGGGDGGGGGRKGGGAARKSGKGSRRGLRNQKRGGDGNW